LELHTWLDRHLRDGRFDDLDVAYQAAQDSLAGLMPDFQNLGVGIHASERRGLAVFCVISWPALQVRRHEQFDLPPIDAHITLGFDVHDVHGVSKGPKTLVDDETLQCVTEAYLSGLQFDQHGIDGPLLPAFDSVSPEVSFDANQNRHHQASRAISKILSRSVHGQHLRSSFQGDKKRWSFPLHTHHTLQVIAQDMNPEERRRLAELWDTVYGCRSRELAIIESMMVETEGGLLEFSCHEQPLQSVGVGSGKNCLHVSLIGPFTSCSSKRFATEAMPVGECRKLQRAEYQRHMMWLEIAKDFAAFSHGR
jgi:hypothetical protein